mgnify:CR=1 FL=1
MIRLLLQDADHWRLLCVAVGRLSGLLISNDLGLIEWLIRFADNFGLLYSILLLKSRVVAELSLRFLEGVRCLWMAVKATCYRILAWLLLKLCCVSGALLHHGLLQMIFLTQATGNGQGSEIAWGAWKHRACCGLMNAVGFCYLHFLLHLMKSSVGLLWETCRGFASTV